MDASHDTTVTPTYGAILFNEHNEVLLVKHLARAGHLTGVYGFPAGRVEGTESPEDTTLRELHEETGLMGVRGSLQKVPHINIADIPRKDGTTKRMSLECFLVSEYSGILHNGSHDETAPEWVPITQIGMIPILPSVAEFIQKALAMRRG